MSYLWLVSLPFSQQFINYRWLLTVQHILLKTLYQACHWFWVSGGTLGHRYENATSAGGSAVRLHTPLDAPATSCLYHLCTGRDCNCRSVWLCLTALQFLQRKTFVSLETRNTRIKFSKCCLVLTVQARKKNKKPLSNLPASKNMIFHISKHKLIMYSLGKIFPPSTLLSLHKTSVRYEDTQNKIFT